MITSVTLKNVRKKYNSEHFTLRIDSTEFRNGNVHAIVGPNGSGKTSLLKLLGLLEEPDMGEILFNGKGAVNNSRDRLRKKIGFVMQNPYLFDMNIFDNIALGLKIRKYPQDKIIYKVKHALKMLKIEHLAKAHPKTLSRGEYQKAAIAQVLVFEPEVILMDEPMANIDAQSTLFIEEIVKDMQKRFNALIVITTHSLSQAYRISPNITFMNEGRIIDSIREDIFSNINLSGRLYDDSI